MTAIPGPGRAAVPLRLSLGLIALTAGAILLLAAGRGSTAGSRVTRARWEMGTLLEIDAIGSDPATSEKAVAAAFLAVEEVDRRLSNWRADSELSRANAAASSAPVVLSPATWRSLSLAMALARETDGAFDPTVGAITGALARSGTARDRSGPRPQAVGWNRALLDPRARTLAFAVPGGAIDSGGFGKGEALDHALVELERCGVRAARLNFGGQISIYGSETSAGRGFRDVWVAEPRAGSRRELCRFAAGDGSVSTSGVSENPGHIVDPRTGSAAKFAGSVTVVADSGLRADALSTALFVLGPTAGLDFANRRGIAGLFVVPGRDGEWHLVASRRFPRCRNAGF